MGSKYIGEIASKWLIFCQFLLFFEQMRGLKHIQKIKIVICHLFTHPHEYAYSDDIQGKGARNRGLEPVC